MALVKDRSLDLIWLIAAIVQGLQIAENYSAKRAF